VKVLEHRLLQGVAGDTGRNGAGGDATAIGAGADASTTPVRPSATSAEDGAYRLFGPVARALRLGSSPLSWWRMLPADAFRAADHLHVGSACDELATVLEGAEVEAALLGDPDLAIEFVLLLMPIQQLTLKVDIAMTSTLRCALDGDLRAALVLAHVVDRIDLDLPRAAELCASWFEYYLRFSPARGGGFTPAEKAVMKALRKLDSARSDDGGRA
jgi:hypothetical protein